MNSKFLLENFLIFLSPEIGEILGSNFLLNYMFLDVHISDQRTQNKMKLI